MRDSYMVPSSTARLVGAIAAVLLCCGRTGLAHGEQIAPADRRSHERMLVLDSHLDTPRHFGRPGWRLLDRHSVERDLSQVDYPRMMDGGLDGGFWAIFTMQRELTPEGYASARRFALRLGALIRETALQNKQFFELATTADDAHRIVAAGKRVVYLSIENAYPLGEDLTALEDFHELGVRMLGPVHTGDNQFADSATDDRHTWHGLSPLGVRLVDEANRLGIVIDASHASDAAVDQMLRRSKTPIILSHSGCSAVYAHPRNIDDTRLRALAAAGGVIQINSLGAYLTQLPDTPQRDTALAPLRSRFGSIDDMSVDQAAAYTSARREIDARYPPARATFEHFMAHMLHAIAVAGVDHVGIGADWDGGGGVIGLEDVAKLPRITARLRAAGLADSDIAKIMGGNLLRVLRDAEAFARLARAQPALMAR